MAQSLENANFGDHVDIPIFEQILEMDESEDDRSFSQSIVFGFFEQANGTFDDMQTALSAKDLEKLSALGHFLKGSSATLGFTHVKDECEKIQHWGSGLNETGESKEPDHSKLLKYIAKSVTIAKAECTKIEELMQEFFGTSD